MNRRERREWPRRLSLPDPGLEIVHSDAAGMDIGKASHLVAVPPDRDEQPVRELGSWTADLRRLAGWLKPCRIRTVALQSTGVYWIAVREILEEEGIEVYLVTARCTKNLPGLKRDVQECPWLMKLHTYGLLRNSFRPPEQVRAVRTIWRQRERWVREAGRTVQPMPKALTTMNGQLANPVSDIRGVTGMAILRAILAGGRDAKQLAQLRDRRIAASEEEIAHRLAGNWREDVLFELRQVVEAYDFYQKQMSACDDELQKYLAALPDAPAPAPGELTEARCPPPAPYRPRKNQPRFDLAPELKRTLGVDLTTIDGIDILTAQVILAELGPDLRAFPTENHFTAWLQLAPRRDISGGKVIRHLKPEGRNRVANALRMAAQALSRSDSYLGARYRSLRGRLGGPRAVKAMARYTACLVYRVLTKGQAYVDRGAAHYETQYRERQKITLQRKAAELGYQLVPAL
jgi:transposase